MPNYAKVQYTGVYHGVDLLYYGNQRQLEYDFVVAPGADPRAIKLGIEGAKKLRIDPEGNLVVQVSGGEVCFHKPVVYQPVAALSERRPMTAVRDRRYSDDSRARTPDSGLQTLIDGGYVLNSERDIAFRVGSYDPGKPLIIDPALSYSTYLGGSGSDRGNDIAVDSAGNAYVTGDTNSTNFPKANPIQAAFGGGGSDAFVTKLNATASALVYSTYLGGSGDDRGHGIALDSSGRAYLTGITSSPDFPTASPIQAAFGGGSSDAFVTKLNATGSALVFSTYLGGSGTDQGNGIAVGSSGEAYVTGITFSSNFPTTPGSFQTAFGGVADAFVTKLNAAGSALVYSTYLGGSDTDQGNSVAVDSSDNTYVTGKTNSTNFPTTPGALQPVVPPGADSGAGRSRFRNHPGQHSEMKPVTIPG